MRPLRDSLGDEAYPGLLGVTDQETIFAGLLDLLREDPADLAGAARETGRHFTELSYKLAVEATLHLAVTDGKEMVFTRHSTLARCGSDRPQGRV